MMKLFLDGNYPAEAFSFDFEDRLFELSDQLKNENFELYDFLNDMMPEICANFEPYEAERRSRPDIYLSEEQMRKKVAEVYEKALKLV
ncbi:hypothetical protein [Geobacillus kaustophilus]|uniref:hypothetical protein n=1 Tax=Geobacillus kaustophilus TaxID=1462 RepID=UPI0012E05E1F|nr:hypothetical protein [Geobacillus kaustophilus]